MKPIALDWVARPKAGRGGWALLVAGLIAAVVAVERHQTSSAQVEVLETQVREARQLTRRAAVKLREPLRDSPALQQEVRAANRVIEQLNIPWPELFRDLEAAIDPTVALLAIQPDSAARALRVEGESREYKAVLGFVARLEATPAFSSVHVASHQTRVDAPSRPIAFALLAAWRGDPR
jgi:hypothetical protein